MQPSAVNKQRMVLEILNRALSNDLLWKRGAAHIRKLVSRLDQMQTAAAYESAVRNLNYRSAMVLRVRAALRRIETGGYGSCLSCGIEISRGRLTASPWAVFCEKCRRRIDAQDRIEASPASPGFLPTV